MQKTIVLFGATGNLGGQIANELMVNGATVKAIVRKESDAQKLSALLEKGVEVVTLNFEDSEALRMACIGADCIVSALAGLKDVIFDLQKKIMDAAVLAGVPRCIPSDFCIDFTPLVPGTNRNLDARRDFHDYINTQNIKVTSIFNGAFMELITGDMPLILYKQKRVLCWGDPSVRMDFTHTKNVAAFAAKAAIDEDSPRYLYISGESISANETVALVSKVSKSSFKLLNPGGIGLFNALIKMTKFFASQPKELYPPWQGMQYMRDMMEGKAERHKHDNFRYDIPSWVGFEDYLSKEKYKM